MLVNKQQIGGKMKKLTLLVVSILFCISLFSLNFETTELLTVINGQSVRSTESFYWVVTNRGVLRIDKSNYEVKAVNAQFSSNIYEIEPVSDSEVYILTQNEFFVMMVRMLT